MCSRIGRLLRWEIIRQDLGKYGRFYFVSLPHTKDAIMHIKSLVSRVERGEPKEFTIRHLDEGGITEMLQGT